MTISVWGWFTMRKVALYGSACNPPHLAHHAILRDLNHSGEFDEVWFMPCYQHMFGKNMIDPEHRLAMAKLTATAEEVLVCDHEIKKQQPVPTYTTLQELESNNENYNFSIVIGADNAVNFDHWYNWELLALNYHIVIYERDGNRLLDAASSILQTMKSVSYRYLDYIDPELIKLSSTRIREWIANNEPSVESYVHPTILQYIREHNLYSKEDE